MKRTAQVGITVAAWLVGIIFAANFVTSASLFSLGIGIFAGAVGAYRLQASWKLLGFLALGFIAGLLRGQTYFADQRFYSVEDVIGQKVTVVGRVSDEPGWNDDKHYEFYLKDLLVSGRPTPGMIKIKAQVGNVMEGQRVLVTGKVGKALGRAPAQIWYAKVVVVDARQPYPTRLKAQLSRGLELALPREQAGFIRGLLFGTRTAVSSDIESDLRTVGLTHIVAVSGYNLTIIMAALAIVLRKNSRITLAMILVGTGLFVTMTGFAPSIVRAAIMGGIFLIASRSRRQINPWVAFCLTILAMTAWDPHYLLSDMSWQLSVLALVGVLVVAPRLTETNGLWGNMREIIVVSLAAHLATAPLIALRFGTFSLIAPLANLLVLPLVPLLMLGGIIVASLSVLAPGIALAVSWPLRIGVVFILELIRTIAGFPLASLSTSALGVGEALLAYAILGLLSLAVLLRTRKTRVEKV